MARLGRSVWEAHVRGLTDSGMTVSAYAEAHGLNKTTLGRWRLRLSGTAAGGSPVPAFVEIGRVAGFSPSLRVVVGGAELEIGRGAELAVVREVLAMLREGA